MFGLGPFEVVAIGAIAVMLYGKRLPEVGRSVGKNLAELRRQWATISRDLDVAGHIDGRRQQSERRVVRRDDDNDYSGSSAPPRFDPPAVVDG
ncbi:MAG: twin-arginine translocase TatA/TatE family subunit [Planctomycetia bacterium]|jgi:sec-independent protein translocase protein TatA